MGRLLFRNGVRLDRDDRTLSHLHHVMLMKMRRGEGFHLTWNEDPSIGSGRTIIWIHPDTALVCKVTHATEHFNQAWIERLAVAANSVGGLTPLPEHTMTTE